MKEGETKKRNWNLASIVFSGSFFHSSPWKLHTHALAKCWRRRKKTKKERKKERKKEKEETSKVLLRRERSNTNRPYKATIHGSLCPSFHWLHRVIEVNKQLFSRLICTFSWIWKERTLGQSPDCLFPFFFFPSLVILLVNIEHRAVRGPPSLVALFRGELFFPFRFLFCFDFFLRLDFGHSLALYFFHPSLTRTRKRNGQCKKKRKKAQEKKKKKKKRVKGKASSDVTF